MIHSDPATQRSRLATRLATLAALALMAAIWLAAAPGAVASTGAAAGSATGPYAGLTLEQALMRLAAGGLELIFTDRVVAPEMRVEHEPTAAEPRAVLDQLLAPHGLAARPGPGGVLMVVAAEPRVTAIEGVVREWRNGRPLAGVGVRLAGGRRTVTAADGSFRIAGVKAGSHRLETERRGYIATEQQLRVKAGEVRRLVVELRPIPVAMEKIDVTASRAEVVGGELSAFSLDRSRSSTLPRLAGDPLRQLTLLPGTTGNDVSARFHVRGGHSDEVLVELDGLEILEPYHLKDFNSALSILAPDVIGGVEILTGGFPVEYGDRMTGVLDLTTREPGRRRQVELGLSGLQAEATSSGILGDGRGHWLAALRAGSLELAARIAREQEDPSFGDVFVKLDLDLRRSGDDGDPGDGGDRSLRLNLLTSGDRLDFQELVAGESEDGEAQPDVLQSFQTSYATGYVWLTHQAVLGRDLYVETRGSYSRVQRDRRGEETTSAGGLTLEDERVLDVVAAEVSGSWRAGRHRLKWGAELRDLEAVYEYFNDRLLLDPLAAIRDQPRQGTTRFDQQFRGRQMALYFSDRFEMPAVGTAELGLRFDENSVLDDHNLSPRLSLTHSLGSRDRLRLAWGVFHQSQRLYELPVEDGQTEFFRAERAEHRILGFERTFDRGQEAWFRPSTFRAELYERRISDSRPRFENLFDTLSIVPELEADRVRLAPDSARARGLELFLGGRAGGYVDWFASYAWSRIEDRIDGTDVPRAIDQPHTLKLDVDVRTPWRWDFNFAGEMHSGWPTTTIFAEPLFPGQDPDEDGVAEVAAVLGPLRAERLPDYSRLDFRVSRWWTPGRGRVDLFLQVQNLLGTKNVRGFEVEFEYDGGDLVDIHTEEKFWGGVLPNVGVRWQF